MSEASIQDALTAAAQMRVVRGTPDDVEVAALVAGLAAVASRGEAPVEAPAAPSRWTRRLHGTPGAPAPTGGDSWRWSLR